MVPIVFDLINRMSEESITPEESEAIARNVLAEHGVGGLVTLWSGQDYYDPVEPLHEGMTPATRWWLQDHNPYADMVRAELASLSEDAALQLLTQSSFPPRPSDDIWMERNGAHLQPYTIDARDKFSNASCATVRALARTFFPQYPALAEPHCSLYLDVTDHEEELDDVQRWYPNHTDPLAAFGNDAAALQFLTRVHTGLTAQRDCATPEMEVLLVQSDKEWALYEAMGLSAMESYGIAKSKWTASVSVALPQNFDVAVA